MAERRPQPRPSAAALPRGRLDDHAFALLAVAVAAVIATHLEHLPAWLWLPLGVLLALRVWSRQRGAHAISAWIHVPLAGLLLGLVLVHYGNVFGREPGSMLGCGLLVLKVMETERARDARAALGFGAFMLMSALLFREDLLFTLAICAILVLLIAALAALQPGLPRGRGALRGELRTSLGLFAMGLPLAVLAFVLIPRLGSPLWGAMDEQSGGRTGLAQDMSPGSMSGLLLDDSPAMRVDFDDGSVPPGQLRYFRAIVMWDFDGRTWSRGQRNLARQLESLEPRGATTAYRVTLEPSHQHWLPSLDVALDAPAGAMLTGERMLYSFRRVMQPLQYRLRSATRYVLQAALPSDARARALALPEGFDPHARALAARWRARGLDDLGVIDAALAMYRADFSYSLNPPLLGRNSVDEFLFDTRQGYCEHYSGSFTFLMRAAGIPARVVTGYQGGWWNNAARYLLLRNSDAHAWSEVWLEGRGWQRVDPTAAVSADRVDLSAGGGFGGLIGIRGGQWLRSLRNQFDVVDRLWTQSVLQFNALRQRGLLRPLGLGDLEIRDLLQLLAGVLVLALLIASAWIFGSGRSRRGDALDHAWDRLLGRLEKRGLARLPGEGPRDLLQRAREHSAALGAALEPLVGDYIELRYGRAQVPTAQLEALARRIHRLRLPRRTAPASSQDLRRSVSQMRTNGETR